MPVQADPDWGDIPWQNPYAIPTAPPSPVIPGAGGITPMNSPSLAPSAPAPPAPSPTPGAGQAPTVPQPGARMGREREVSSANDLFGYIGNLLNPGGAGQGGYIEQLLRELRKQRPGATVFTPSGLNDLAGGFSYAGTPASGAGGGVSTGGTPTGGTGGYGGFLGGLFGLLGGR